LQSVLVLASALPDFPGRVEVGSRPGRKTQASEWAQEAGAVPSVLLARVCRIGARAQPKWESDSSIEFRSPSFAGLYAPGEVTGKVVLGGEPRAVSASGSVPSVCSKLLSRSARGGPGSGSSDRRAGARRTAGCNDFSRAVGCPSPEQCTCVSFGAVSHPPRVSPADVCGTRPPFGEGGPDHPEIEGLGSPPSHGKVPLIGGSRRSAGFPEDRR
jgi:hypothetical protein